jgi:hypothetical protein
MGFSPARAGDKLTGVLRSFSLRLKVMPFASAPAVLGARYLLWLFFVTSLLMGALAGCDSGSPPVATAPAAKPVLQPPDPTDKSPVVLSAGTSLPQSTPAGPAMSFSVDYKVARPLNTTSARSLLVIKAKGGKRSGQPTQLEKSGTLTVIVNGWQPEDGPFEAFVEEVSRDGTRRPLSKPTPLL